MSRRLSELGAAASRRPGRAVAIGLLAAMGLVACTLGPDYQRPDLQLPETWQRPAAESNAEPSDLANTDWWKAFGDPDLDRLIDAALDANKDLQVAAWRVAQFNAQLQVSLSAKYPQLGYTVSAERRRYSEEVPTGGGGLQRGVGPIVDNFAFGGILSWEIDLWGRVRRSNEAALASLQASEDARRGVMLTVASDVAASYVQLLQQDRELAIARESLHNRKQAQELVESRYEGGSGTRIGVEQARAAVEVERAEIALIERDIARLENALSVLVGRNPGPVARRKLDGLAPISLPAGVPADLLTRRPDVMAAEHNLIAANARIGVAMTRAYPTLSLGAALGQASDSTKWLFAETARTGLLGAVLAGPLLDGGRTAAEVKESEAVTKELTVRYEQTVQIALREVDDALVTRAKSTEREQAMRRRVGSLKEVGRLARERYDGGRASYLEVLDAYFPVYEAEVREAQSRGDTLLALIGIYKAMGGGWMIEQERRRAPGPEAAGVEEQAATQSGARP